MMIPCRLLALVIVLATIALAAVGTTLAADRPNVLWFVMDDVGAGPP